MLHKNTLLVFCLLILATAIIIPVSATYENCINSSDSGHYAGIVNNNRIAVPSIENWLDLEKVTYTPLSGHDNLYYYNGLPDATTQYYIGKIDSTGGATVCTGTITITGTYPNEVITITMDDGIDTAATGNHDIYLTNISSYWPSFANPCHRYSSSGYLSVPAMKVNANYYGYGTFCAYHGDEAPPEYDTDLSASGMFCSYNNIDFNLSITPYDTSGYFEIYIYKDSLTYLYAGDTGTDTGCFTYSKTLPPGNYYTQGFVTPDGEEESWGEWLNFTMLNNCTIAPMGTISSEAATHNATQQFWYSWVVGQYDVDNQTWAVDNFNESPWQKFYDAGIINETQYNAAQDIWNATYINNSQLNTAAENILNTYELKKEIYNETNNAFKSVHSNFNMTYSVLQNYTAPLNIMGTYAIQFFPPQVIDLVSAYLVIQLTFLVLFLKKD